MSSVVLTPTSHDDPTLVGRAARVWFMMLQVSEGVAIIRNNRNSAEESKLCKSFSGKFARKIVGKKIVAIIAQFFLSIKRKLI